MPQCGRFLLCLTLILAARGEAGDWPQILGPNRDGTADPSEDLLTAWPAAGPAVVWERSIGAGVAGVAVVPATAVLFHRQGDFEVIEALDPATGRTLWTDRYPTTFRPQVGGAAGPLCVPTIAGSKVITYGPQGVLSCTELATGKPLWRRKTHDDFDAREGYFGAGSSPLVHGQSVIVNVGGFRTESAVVAFDLATGATLWQSFEDQASYSSPRIVDVAGQPRLIVETRLHVLGLDPANGDVKFQVPYGARGPTVTAANPVRLGDHLFLTASYGIGANLSKLTHAGLQLIWQDDELFSSQYCTPVTDGEVLFGIDGRQDGPPGDLKCVDPIGRRTLWRVAGFGYGTLIQADGQLLILKSDGTLVLATANRERFDRLAEARVLSGTARALPALANGRLFVRDDDTLKCLLVGTTKSPE